MSRIRTVKPEFWSSEQVVSCSRDARLLFIGLWNFCDDAGIHPSSFLRLKMEVFPGDDCSTEDIARWIAELIAVGLLREYTVDERTYWIVTGWKHQKIDKPTYRHPQPQSGYKLLNDNSTSIRRYLDEQSTSPHLSIEEPSATESKGKESNGMDKDIAVSVTDSQLSQNNCPHEKIVELFHEILTMCPRVKQWTDARKRALQQRWRENTKHQSLDFWRKFFEHIKESQFLTGRVHGRDGKLPFLATLEWLIRANNFVKVIEGNYHRDEV